MDINSLLSPTSEAPRSVSSTPGTPAQSPYKFIQRTQSGPLKHGPGASPLSQAVMSQSSIPAHVLSPAQATVSSPLISPVPVSSSGSHNTRTSTTPSMDTLADAASMQNHQPMKAAPPLKRPNSYENRTSPTLSRPSLATFATNSRASFDINMVDTPKKQVRTDFSGSSLPTDKQQRLAQLAEYLQGTPSAYESHVEMIKILHDGFRDHIYPPNESVTRNPRTYTLLADLRNARETMEKLFAVSESLWIDCLEDEGMLVQTAEERIAVVEKCRRAVEEEVGSVALWTAYGEWVYHCYTWAQDTSRELSSEPTQDEEKMVGKELFTWQLVLDVWQEAIEQTAHNIAESHIVWNRYLSIRVPNIRQKLSSDQISACMALFQDRLQTPHIAWDETFELFSGFVSSNFKQEDYDEIMLSKLRAASKAKDMTSARQPFETAVEQAQKAGDRDAEYIAFTKYIEWEQTPEKRKKLSLELTNAIFQRAELRFPSDAALWEEHAVYLTEKLREGLLSLLERATKHCPWSGSLWSQYLLASDNMRQPFDEVEGIKHKATNTGLLEAAGVEEIVQVHAAWCSYLRRRSFRLGSSEEDLDVAEMGIRSSIETVQSLAAKLGLGDVTDPSFRLQRIYITFLSESGRWDNARQEFDNAVQDYGKSWEFWMRFYTWEMMRWRRFANQQDASDGHPANVPTPRMATAVLKKALDQPNLDYPEPIVQALITHCEDYEETGELQSAFLKVQKARKAVAARRQVEVAQSAAMQAALSEEVAQPVKRKREEEDTVETSKKMKHEEVAQPSIEEPSTQDLKRDRENATVLVENLPDNISDTRIRQYFSNCGVVRSLKVTREDDISALVEFDDENAAKYALSRDGRDLDGAILSVSLEAGSTLYVTNYQPAANEQYIRDLIGSYGDIISIRFPSLQGNKRRRFCYVQFKLPSQAQAATELDGKQIDDFELVCKISNPVNRKVRDASQNDGRTVFVGQLNFKATEEEVEKLFARFGTIKAFRMPRHDTIKGRNRGIAHITYDTGEQAQAALQMHDQEFQGRKIIVDVAKSDSRQRKSSLAQGRTKSPTPIRNGDAVSNDHASATNSGRQSIKDRQIFLSNVPDTVNEERLKAVAEKHGKVIRVVLKTNHAGAIIEFSTIEEAGKASLQLEDFEIDPGRQIKVVSEQEMQNHGREKKEDKPFVQRSKAPPISAVGPVKRPMQPGARKGGKLGVKKAPLASNGASIESTAGGEAKKSNDDFRAMLTKKE